MSWLQSLCAGLLLGAAAGTVPSLDVDFGAFLSKQDLVWEWGTASPATTPTKWYHSAFMGNGKLGLMIRALDGDVTGGLRCDVGSSAVWDDRMPGEPYYLDNFAVDQPRLPIGYMELRFVGSVTSATMRLDLWNAETRLNVTTTAGSVTLRALVSSNYTLADVMVLEVESSGGEAARWQWVPQNATSTWATRVKGYVYNPPPSTTVQGCINVTTQRHLSGATHATAFASVGAATLLTVSDVGPNGTQAAVDAIHSAVGLMKGAGGVDAIVGPHRAWWHAYYPQSFVTLQDAATESFYWAQVYKVASGTRGDRQVYDLEGPWYIDGTSWPDLHWDLNVQLTYDMTFQGNRLDLGESFFKLLDAHTADLVRNVPVEWQADSAAAPSGASSLSLNETCYWNYGPNCTVSSPTVTGNLMWSMQLYFRQFEYTMDTDLLLSRWLPLMRKALAFYGHLSLRQPSGLNNLAVTFSPEYSYCSGNNTMYDMALYKWGLDTAITVVEDVLKVTDPDLDAWKSALAALAPFPVDDNGFMIAEQCPFNHSHRHFSHLFPVWPLQTINFTDPDEYALAARSVDHWIGLTGALTGFCRPAVAVMSNSLGRAEAAMTNVSYLLDNYILPNTMYHEGENGACGETPPMCASAIQHWMFHSVNDAVHLFSGIPKNRTYMAAFYHLRAPGGFLLSAVRGASGAPEWVTVEATAPGSVSLALSGMSFQPPTANVTTAGGLMTVTLAAGESVVLFPPGSTPNVSVSPVPPSCPTDINAWGMRPPSQPPPSLVVSKCTPGDAGQVWAPSPGVTSPSGGAVVNPVTGKCLTAGACSPADATNGISVLTAACTGAPNQVWALGEDKSLRTPQLSSSLCLDIPGSVKPAVDMFTCNPSDAYHNNQWVFNASDGTLRTLCDDPGFTAGPCLNAASS